MKTKYILFSDGKSPHTLKWLIELVKYYDVYLISLNGYNNEVLEYISKENIYVLNDSVNTSGGNFKLLLKYFELKKIINKINPIYLNAHYLSSYGILASMIKKSYSHIKLIQSTWGSDVLVSPFKNKLKFSIAKYALKNADLITSDSYFMSDKINDIYQNNITMTFPFGLDDFEVDNSIKKDEFLIFSNRALSENYNIDTIINWFSTIEDTRYKLIIANDGYMKKNLKDLVHILNLSSRVSFVGFLNKQQQEQNYKNSKYYISIPTSDSTAVSLLEAMRYGCYPIVSNLVANREWIIDNFNGSFYSKNMPLSTSFEQDVIINNQKIIKSNAIFENDIKKYVSKIGNI